MSNYEPQTVERTELPNNVTVLGVDGDGRTHFATSAVGGVTIYVGEADGLDIFELDKTVINGLEGWIDHVETQRGWNRLNYTDDWLGQVVDTVSGKLGA